jgi:hypothetical protein
MNETQYEKKPNLHYTKADLIALYNRSKTDNSYKDFFSGSTIRRCIIRFFGSYANLVQEVEGSTEYTSLCKRCNKNNVIYDLQNQKIPYKPKIKYCKECQAEIDSRKPPTVQQLIENYKEVHKILGRRPTSHDLDNRNKPGKYSARAYVRRFGSWNKFLIGIGETSITQPSPALNEQSLRKNWIDVKTKQGRVPTTRDLNDKSLSLYNHNQYRWYYKNYTKAAHAMGDEPNYIRNSSKK